MMQREKKRELWLVFTLNGKEIASYTVRGTSSGELEATKGLLAFENHCSSSDIIVKGVVR